MAHVFKQTVKALCYAFLFYGMQIAAAILMMLSYLQEQLRDLAGKIAAGDSVERETERMVEGMTDYLLENSNWVVVFAGALSLAFLWIFFSGRRKKFLEETNVVPFSPQLLPATLLLAVGAVFTVSCALSLLPIPGQLLLEYERSVEAMMEGSLAAVLLSTIVSAPIVEEVVFRGLVTSRLDKAVPTPAAVILSSLIFGFLHGQLLWICYAACLGLIMGFVAVRCRSVLASICFHFVFNLLGAFPVWRIFIGESVAALVVVEAAGLALMAVSGIWLWKLTDGNAPRYEEPIYPAGRSG